MQSKFTLITLTLLALALVTPTTSSAAYSDPLYDAACEYREAVRHFERAVILDRTFDPYQRRVVDQLEIAASGLRTYSRYPERPERLVAQWYDAQVLQPRVEEWIIGQPGCPVNVDLIRCWERVTCAHVAFAAELAVRQYRYRAPVYDCPLDSCPQYRVPRLYGADPYAVQPNFPYGVETGPVVPNPEAPVAPEFTPPDSPIGPPPITPTRPVDPKPSQPELNEAGFYMGPEAGNWRLSRVQPSYGRVTSPTRLQSEMVERDLTRVSTRGGFEVASIGALISRLID